MPNIQLLIMFFLLNFPVFAEQSNSNLTSDLLSSFEEEDAFLMHKNGVVIAFEGKEEQVFPEIITKKQLKNIIFLDFKGKEIYELPSWISGLVNIRTIKLNNSKIQLEELDKLKTLKELEILDLSRNIFFPNESQALNIALGEWRKLIEIDLSHTGGAEDDYSYLSNLEFLKKIDLSGNKITSIERLSLKKLKRLTYLNLSNNKISGEFSPSFLPKDSLTHLDISKNDISRFLFEGNIKNLAVLNISGNRNIILDDQYGGIFVLKKLSKIFFEDTAKIPLSILSKSANWKKNHNLNYRPKMKVIPSGEYSMGCSTAVHCTKDEMPAHKVKLKSFELSIYEITNFEYNLCVKDKKCTPKNGRDNRPVEGIGWDDAIDYIIWLNSITDKKYRLPTESEWEYVARAGKDTPYSFGKNIGKNNANCSGCQSRWDNKTTSPVGSFSPNKYGIYDMHGNVWEWVMDCPYAYLSNIDNGSPWVENEGGVDCDKKRILRGGSYKTDPESLISWNRAYGNLNGYIWDVPISFTTSSFSWSDKYDTKYRRTTGIRIARTLLAHKTKD